jgi:hypothetical protein
MIIQVSFSSICHIFATPHDTDAGGSPLPDVEDTTVSLRTGGKHPPSSRQGAMKLVNRGKISMSEQGQALDPVIDHW